MLTKPRYQFVRYRFLFLCSAVDRDSRAPVASEWEFRPGFYQLNVPRFYDSAKVYYALTSKGNRDRYYWVDLGVFRVFRSW